MDNGKWIVKAFLAKLISIVAEGHTFIINFHMESIKMMRGVTHGHPIE